jgi:dCTP deaminase
MSGVFSDLEIKAAIKTGQIIIDPFASSRVQSSSVDLTLGKWYYSTERDPHQGVLNPFDPDSIKRYFKGPLEASTHEEWLERENIRHPFKGIPLDAMIVLLYPGERILGHTEEFAGIAWNGTTMVHAKSTTGRLGISVCDDAGWGDQGYVNRWTLEIRNKNERAAFPLVVGMPVAQIIFFHMAESDQRYGVGGHYQAGQDLDVVKRNWAAKSMLPRPLKIEERDIK